jgi:hypothetical protein
MTYNEAKNEALKQPWKIGECFSGSECWCRPIMVETPISWTYESVNNEIIEEVYEYVVQSAVLDKATAEYIVNLHNNSLEKQKFI